MADAPKTLKFPCPSCARNLSAGSDVFGYTLECPSCGATIEVPTPSARAKPAKTEVLGPGSALVPESAKQWDSQPSDQSRPLPAKKGLGANASGMIAGLLVAAWAVQNFKFESGKKESAGMGDSSGAVNRSQMERAEDITSQLVKESLRSPSTADFTEFRVIDRNGPFFQTYTGVDAQNGFGAIVRSYFVCTFKLDEGVKFTTHKMTAVTEVGSFDHGMFKGPSVPEQELMDFQKHCIGWPGYELKNDSEHGESGPLETDSKEHLPQVTPSTPRVAPAEKTESEDATRKVGTKVGSSEPNKDSVVNNELAPGKSDERGAEVAQAKIDAELTAAKAELETVTSTIDIERQRWQEALATINRLTVNKTRPVREGSPQYYQCMAASKVIHEVEEGAQVLKNRKVALETRVKELEK